MKKSILYCTLLFAGLGSALAQIPNAGFEDWEKNDFQATDPKGWFSLNVLSALGYPVGVTATNQANTGKSAIKLTVDEFNSLSILNPTGGPDTSVAFAITGKITSLSEDDAVAGFAFTGKPASFTGFYKLTSPKKDTAFINVGFTKWNPKTNQADSVGGTFFTFYNATNTYTQFTVPIFYDKSGTTPDTATVYIIASISKKPIPGTAFYLDDLAFVGGTNGVAEGLSALQNEVYPNPARAQLNISNVDANVTSISIKDLTGKILDEQATEGNNIIKYNTENYSSGIYFFELRDASQKLLQRGKFAVNK